MLDIRFMEQVVLERSKTATVQADLSLIRFWNHYSIWVLLGLFLIFGVILLLVARASHMRKEYANKMFELAYIDPLTGIWNENYFRQESVRVMNLKENGEKRYAIISVDIMKFQAINENYGRFVGDEVLRHVANRIRPMVEIKVYARPAKDKFHLLVEWNEENTPQDIMEKFRKRVQDYSGNNVEMTLHFQGGIYYVEDTSVNIYSAIDMAEVARKFAKEDGRECDCVFDENMEKGILKEKEIEDSMEAALENGEFQVFYQPKFDMKRNRMVGAEALVRWCSPTRGFMSPAEFIPIFEKNAFVIELDFFVLEEVCKLIRHWLDQNKIPIIISVNQSRLHMSNPNYLERVFGIVDKYHVPPDAIELEITETSFMGSEEMAQVIVQLQKKGFKVSMDDFGSGYSSLNILKSLQLDVLKIDKEFLNETKTSKRAKSIIKKVVEMSKELDMEVICEGVENKEQAEFLLSIGCQYAQGFLYAKPTPQKEFEEAVEEQHRNRASRRQLAVMQESR